MDMGQFNTQIAITTKDNGLTVNVQAKVFMNIPTVTHIQEIGNAT